MTLTQEAAELMKEAAEEITRLRQEKDELLESLTKMERIILLLYPGHADWSAVKASRINRPKHEENPYEQIGADGEMATPVFVLLRQSAKEGPTPYRH